MHDYGMRPLTVVVGIITYRRPDGLRRLLTSLGRVRLDPSMVDLRIVVVDNDADGGGKDIVDAFLLSEDAIPTSYCVEATAGIPYARNRVLAQTPKEADWLAFVDDDEWVDPEWLCSLLAAAQEYRADVVTGPVLPVYRPSTPLWIINGQFFNRERRTTGTRLDRAATNNILISTRALKRTQVQFDTRLGQSGGSDTHFFMQMARESVRIVWSDAAIVYEDVPPSRARALWLLRRQFRKGMLDVFLQREYSPGAAGATRLVLRSFGRITKGIGMLAVTWPLGRKHIVYGLQRVARGAGSLSRYAGIRYNEYRRE